ncbi:amidohydrolase [Natrialbaceae archaeon A-CW3]
MTRTVRDRLGDVRRTFHRYPEPGWREFYTTSLLVDELEAIDSRSEEAGTGGIDEIAVGRAAIDPDARMAIPDEDSLETWFGRARERGARQDVLEATEGGYTGVVARVNRGDGPSIGLRVDIDGLFVEEASDDAHRPAAEGFRSEHEGLMHACGHDAHMTIGLATLEAVLESDFSGTFTVFFQPAEEEAGGGKPMADGPYADGLEYLLAVHVGLDHPTGQVVAGIVKPLAMSHIDATIRGRSAHAGKAPNEGHNAIQAMATAVQNAYGIPRHSDGMTRVNVGRVEAGTASNVIAERADVVAEVRGETTALMEYVKSELRRTFDSAADMHGCDLEFDVVSESPRADSDDELIDLVYDVAVETEGVDDPVRSADFGASEDATFLMRRVQDEGGLASYLIVGTDHPDSHHTPHFDVDERSLEIAVDVLLGSVRRLEMEQP